MTDKLEYSEAWQDVQDRLGYIAVHHGLEKAEAEIWAAIEHARAADAQQIAELKARLEQKQNALHVAMAGQSKMRELEQQIAALRAENEQLQKRNDNQFSIIQDFSFKLAALQTEDK